MHRRQIARISVGGVLAVVFSLGVMAASSASAKDWPQWCGSDGKNMVSDEKGPARIVRAGPAAERWNNRPCRRPPM